jgi:hypothetical protein
MRVGYKLGLIGVAGERQDVVRKREQHAEKDEQRGGIHLSEQKAGNGDGERGQNNLPFAFQPVGDGGGEQRSKRRGDGDDERIAQAAGDGDAALDQQRGHPVGETVKADGLEQTERRSA